MDVEGPSDGADGFAFEDELTGKVRLVRPHFFRTTESHASRHGGLPAFVGSARDGVGAQPEIGGQRWPSRRFQASLRETGMRLSTLQPTLASTFCAGRVRARRVLPMMVL